MFLFSNKLLQYSNRFFINCKPPYERNPDFTGITANMIFCKIYLIVLCAT